MRNLYDITDRAGDYVAGYRRKPGQVQILLTDAEAEHPLRVGEIKEPPSAAPTPDPSPQGGEEKPLPRRTRHRRLPHA
jgi:hypothetical protein